MNKNWINEAIIYHIFPLGAFNAPQKNDFIETTRLKETVNLIPHLKNLGVNTILFGPVFQSMSHGYDIIDLYKIDSRLGNINDFKFVCKALKENGFKIVVDGVFNHVGRDFFAFKDLQNYKQNSKYINWFNNVDFTKNNNYNDSFTYQDWAGCNELVKLNVNNEETKNYLLNAIGMWIDEFDIDGIRLDAADVIDKNFFESVKGFIQKKKEKCWLMGEIVFGDYRQIVGSDKLDSATNYECYKGLYSSLNEKNMFEIAYSFNRQFGQSGIYKDLCLYNFLENHDVNRVASMIKNERNLYNAYTLLFTMNGIPSVYYGGEFAFKGTRTKTSDKDLRPKFDLSIINNSPRNLFNHIKSLAELRKNSSALKYGNYEQILLNNEFLIFARNYENDTKIIAINLDEDKKEFSFKYNNKPYIIEVEGLSSKII